MRLRSVTTRTASADAAFVAVGLALSVGALGLGAAIVPDPDDARVSRDRAGAVLAQSGLPRDLLVAPLRVPQTVTRPRTPAPLRVGTPGPPAAGRAGPAQTIRPVRVAPAPVAPAPVAPAPVLPVAPGNPAPAAAEPTTPAKDAPEPPARGHQAQTAPAVTPDAPTPEETATAGRYSMLGTLSPTTRETGGDSRGEGMADAGQDDRGRGDKHAKHKRKLADRRSGDPGRSEKD